MAMTKKMSIALVLLAAFMLSTCYLMPSDPLPASVIESAEIITPEETLTSISTSSIEPTVAPTSNPIPALYIVQPGTPAYIKNFANPGEGCNWLGAAGQVFGPDGFPILNLIVSVKGKLGDEAADVFTMTGLAEGDVYGPGGYEIQLSNQPYLTNGSLTIQVFNLNAKPLSDPFIFNTFANCEQNLVIINFTANQN